MKDNISHYYIYNYKRITKFSSTLLKNVGWNYFLTINVILLEYDPS
jgi:hypothetical protein